MKDILLIGAGGHCKSCIDVIESDGEFEIAGIIDLPSSKSDNVLKYPVIGTDDDLSKLREQFENAVITVGQIKSPSKRIEIYNILKKLKYTLPIIVSPTAYVSKHSNIGEGTIVMHGAIVNVNTTIGVNCIINSKALVEHDGYVGSHTHISTGAILNGEVKIGNQCFIGSNSTIINNIKIADEVVLGANSTVAKNIDYPGIYIGTNNKIK